MQCSRQPRSAFTTPPIGACRGPIEAFQVLDEHPIGTETRCQMRHAGTHAAHPAAWNALGVPCIECGHNFILEQAVQAFGVRAVTPLPAPDRLSILRLKGFRPPAVQRRQIQSAIAQRFHTACHTGLPRPSRRIGRSSSTRRSSKMRPLVIAHGSRGQPRKTGLDLHQFAFPLMAYFV